MLCQLVCLDRRYQRMNCFNIREVEALLKGRFFPDLVATHDYRTVLNSTVLGLRYKTAGLAPLSNGTLLFQTYGLLTNPNQLEMSAQSQMVRPETAFYAAERLPFYDI